MPRPPVRKLFISKPGGLDLFIIPHARRNLLSTSRQVGNCRKSNRAKIKTRCKDNVTNAPRTTARIRIGNNRLVLLSCAVSLLLELVVGLKRTIHQGGDLQHDRVLTEKHGSMRN